MSKRASNARSFWALDALLFCTLPYGRFLIYKLQVDKSIIHILLKRDIVIHRDITICTQWVDLKGILWFVEKELEKSDNSSRGTHLNLWLYKREVRIDDALYKLKAENKGSSL